MAKCKICKTNIPDGTEYCPNCQEKGNTIANESYLDSLLNSVKNPVSASENIYKRKSGPSSSDTKENPAEPAPLRVKKEDDSENFNYNVDFGDLEDFDQFNIGEDLDDLDSDDVINDEELFGQNLSELFEDNASKARNRDRTVSQPSVNDRIPENTYQNSIQPGSFIQQEAVIQPGTSVQQEAVMPSGTSVQQGTAMPSEPFAQQEDFMSSEPSVQQEAVMPSQPENVGQPESGTFSDTIQYNREAQTEPDIPETEGYNNTGEEEVPPTDIADYFTSGRTSNPREAGQEQKAGFEQEAGEEPKAEEEQESEEDDFDPDLNELLNSLDLGGMDLPNAASNEENAAPVRTQANTEQGKNEDFEQVEPEEDDFLSLLNQISSDDPVAEDVKAINDLLSGKPVNDRNKTPSDVGEVFSDALKVVSSLNDPTLEELEALNKIPDKKDAKGKKKKKVKKEKKKKVSKKNAKKGKSEADGEEKPKKGLFKRLFGNVPDENAAKKKEQTKKQAPGEEAAAAKEKPGKAVKGKKGAPSKDTEEESSEGGKEKGKAASKKESKKEKKEKKKSKEAIQVIDEIEEDEGRINRLGAGIVFMFFGLLVVLLLVGTNVVSYTLSIQHATNYFKMQKYTQAYNEVYGIEIKDEDIEIYDKIMTVMFVNKQLNSYNNYYSIGEYPQALDSLLKGLKRYDKYIELATMLGIKTDLDYVRSQILAELKNVFHLSEKEALKIIATDNMQEYSAEVYNVVLEKMNN